MKHMKLAVIFDSNTGNTKQAGEWIVEGMNKVDGVDWKSIIPKRDLKIPANRS